MIIHDSQRAFPFNFDGDPTDMQKQAAARDERAALRRKEMEALDAKHADRVKMAAATKAADDPAKKA